MKNIYFVVISVLALFYVIWNVKKKRFSIKESFWWFIGAVVMLLLSIFPYSIDKIAKLIGIEYPPSLLFILSVIYLLFMIFKNSKRIAEQQEKIIELAQHVAILENKVEK